MGGEPLTTQDCIDEVVTAARRLDPELWAKVDTLARIIAPGIWDAWYDNTAPDAQPVPPDARVRYLRSAAESKAWQILVFLGIAPQPYDWPRLFGVLRATHAENAADRAEP